MSHRHISRKIMRNVLWSGMFLSIIAPAARAEVPFHTNLQAGAPALSDRQLDQLRGGFLTDSGFLVKFSFQNLVKINGVLQAATVIEIPELKVPSFTFAGQTSPKASTDQKNGSSSQMTPTEVPVSIQDPPATGIPVGSEITGATAGPSSSVGLPAADTVGAPSTPSPPVTTSTQGIGSAVADSGADMGSSGSPIVQAPSSGSSNASVTSNQSIPGTNISPAPVVQAPSVSHQGSDPGQTVADLGSSQSGGSGQQQSPAAGSTLAPTTPAVSEQTPHAVVSTNQLNIVSQIGANNHISPQALQNLKTVQTFIQNTLNGQHIQHLQELNIEISKYRFQPLEGLSSRINAQLLDLH